MGDIIKNQVNVKSMKKNNVVANGDTAIAIGKTTKNVGKGSFLKFLINLIMAWFGK